MGFNRLKNEPYQPSTIESLVMDVSITASIAGVALPMLGMWRTLLSLGLFSLRRSIMIGHLGPIR